MSPDGKLPSTSSSSTRTTPIYSLATTKAVNPRNKSLGRKPSLQINLQQQQRQRQQQQLRAIRRKRTVAFAVNHDRVSQPLAACVVSADAAPNGGNSSNARSESTRVTENSHLNSTVIRNPTRASPAIRDSSCTFQASGFGEDFHVKADTNQREQKSNAEENNIQKNSIDNKKELESEYTKKKVTNVNNRLIVDVRCAEVAAAAATISNDAAKDTRIDRLLSTPVPVTPTFTSNDYNGVTANGAMKRPRAEMSTKKQKFCLEQEEKEDAVGSLPRSPSAEFLVKSSQKPKIKRVRYDMECVPAVDVNQELWREITKNFRTQSNSSGTRDNYNNAKDDKNKNLLSSDLMRGSVLWIPSSREEWEGCVSEMKAVCTSAAFRRWSKTIIQEYENSLSKINSNRNSNISQAQNTLYSTNSSQQSKATMPSFHPPLSQAFIKDRVRIDDPLRGYQIRHAEGGWLQGFLVWTNFTVWTLDFRWDSNHPACGLHRHDAKAKGPCVAEDDGTLSSELQALPRGEQDPLDGGIVLKQVAEISLLGGLGCGELLLRKSIEDIRKSKNSDSCKYKYVVLQATKGSMRFYEKMGFKRVGAVCRYRWAGYCTNEKSSQNLKKIDMNKAKAIDVDSKFYGYRHWTYTNESSKSLNAHGGPSVMMCLKLDDYKTGKDLNGNESTLSELLDLRIVDTKPMIQLFGNVANPDTENLAPTRKSQRRSSGIGSFKGSQQEQNESLGIQHRSTVGDVEGGGLTSARRTSNRSKRGQNNSLANSGYVLYGIEGGRNTQNKNVANAAESSKHVTKRKRRGPKTQRNVISEVEANLEQQANQATVVPLAPDIREIASIKKGRQLSVETNVNSGPMNISIEKINGQKIFHEVMPLSCGKVAHPKEIMKECDEKQFDDDSISADPHSDQDLLPKCKMPLTISANRVKESAPISTMPRTVTVASTPPVGSEEKEIVERVIENSIKIGNTRESHKEGIELKQNFRRCVSGSESQNSENQNTGDSSLNNAIDNSSFSKEGERNAAVDTSKRTDVAGAKKSEKSAPIIAEVEKNPGILKNTLSQRNNPPTILSRKRSRQKAKKIIASTLLKQKIKTKTCSNADFYNQVVIRRVVQDRNDEDFDGQSSKRRRVSDNSRKCIFRWRYNGGLMIDHRYEFCYYFVLEYNEAKKTMTIVPMIKDGVFEKTTKGPFFDEKLLGLPRYECNILKTDKNWIRDVPVEDYVVVPEAKPVFNTRIVVEEAWDIGGNYLDSTV